MTAGSSDGKAVTCPACGGTIEVRAAGFTVNLACQHCGSLLDVSRPEVALIRKYKRANENFALELGKRGTLFGQEWEVVGALRRKDQITIWQEFLLFNPYLGYRWLVACDGGTSSIRRTLGIRYNGRGKMRANVSFYFRSKEFLFDQPAKNMANQNMAFLNSRGLI